ncbi:MAG: hypothetical protein GXY06_08940 [Clostridiaceae bacterium]|nr:hypothetical protein [Clostridiaceae bacterium]
MQKMKENRHFRILAIIVSLVIILGVLMSANKTVYAASKSIVSISYQTHIQDIGWQDYVCDGTASGTSGQSKRLEAIRIQLASEGIGGGIEYRTHVQDIGWMDWVSDNEVSGTSGHSKRLEAIQVRLTGAAGTAYDVYYRVHVQDIGWMDWAKNGEASGTTGYGYRLEAIEICLVLKGGTSPGVSSWPFVDAYAPSATVDYKAHVQNIGWQNYVSNGALCGTSGQSKRLEAIQIKLENIAGDIEYRTHVQDIGWMDWVSDNEVSGTSGHSKRLEAIQIRLTGAASEKYDIYYCVHVQNRGWMDWCKNGEFAGTVGYGYRMEAIKVILVKKGWPAPAPVENIVSPSSNDQLVYIDGFLDPRSVTPVIVPDPTSLTTLVNKFNAVPAEYVPALVLALSSKGCYIRPEAAEAWNLMRTACRTATGSTLYICSGYRSYTTQKSSFDDAIATKGVVRAISKYAYPGRSEHQLGLALDVATTATKTISGSFLTTPAGAWMAAHAHEYGFILRYPSGKENITGYAFEAWHFRYVGVEPATAMYINGQTLEEYLG